MTVTQNIESTLLDMENITRNPLTRESADTFIRYLNSYPSLNDDVRTRDLIETFTRQLESIQTAWAQEKITALAEFRSTRTALAGTVNLSTGLLSSTEVQATLPNSEYTKLAQDVIQFTPASDIKNNRNIFLFQKYFAQTDLGSKISVDGVNGPQTIEAIQYNSRATAIFLRELGFKGLDGGTLNIRDTFTTDITAAIQSAFGVTIAAQVETPEVATTPRVEVAPALRQALAEKIIGTPLTAEKIRAYQEEHNIGADGILGNETYFEMRAGEIVVGLTGNMEEFDGLKNGMEDINTILSNATLTGKNVVAIQVALQEFKRIHEANPDFSRVYGDFYTRDTRRRSDYANSPEGRVTQERNQENARSIYATMTNPDISIGDKIETIAKDPLLLIGGGLLFLFGVFGNESSWNNSFMKRLGVVLGVALFGETAWNRLGVGEMLEDAGTGISNYTRSPEAQTLFENGKTGFLDFFKTTLPEFFATSGITLGDQFTTFVTNFETKNEERKNTPEFIENISEKGSIILSDATFLNASKEQIVQAQATGSLAGILSDAGLQKINVLGISDEDIKNYLNLYILPRFTDDDVFVRDIFMTTGVLNTGQEAQLTISGNYIENPELNIIITQEISNLRLVGSEAQRLTATHLALALQTTSLEAFNGTFGTFSLANHPALTPDEKQKFEVLLRKLTIIFTQEKYIAEQIGGIGTIALQSGSETEFTLTTRLEQLEGIKVGFQLQTADIQSVGLTAERFSSEKFEEIYAAKRDEILQAASMLGISVLTLTNGTVIQVNTEIEAQAAQALQAENSKKLEEIIVGLEPLPLETATPIEFRAYFDAKQGDFEILEQIVTRNTGALDGTTEFELKTRAEVGIALKNTLGERYLIVRQKYVDEISQLQSEITGISETNITEIGYQSARTKLQEISGKYYDLGSQIVEGITVRDTYTALESYFTGAIVFPAEKNSIAYLDGVFPTTPLPVLNIESIKDGIESKIIALETAFTVDVDMTQIDITNPQTVRDVVNLLGGKKMVVDTFLKESIQSGKYREVAIQFQTIQSLYITAIGTATSLTDVEKIITEYRDIVQPYVVDGRSSIWQTSWEAVKDIFTEQDEVERIYEEKKMTLEIAPRLSITVAAAPETLNPEFIKIFKIFNIVQLDANGEVMFDTTGIPIVLPGMENHPFYIAVVLNEDTATMNEIIGILDSGISQFSSINPTSAEALRSTKAIIIDIVTQ